MKKKIIKRRKGKSKLYFTADTQRAIEEWQASDSQETRDDLYTTQILPAFDKLAENLILIYGFAKGRHSFDALKNDCITFLYETLHKFDASRGTKAFSYFNVVAKNWLILNTRKRKKVYDNSYPIHELESFNAFDRNTIVNYQTAAAPEDIMIESERRAEIQKILTMLKDQVENQNDIKCIDAILIVFAKIDDLDLLNKRAIYVYIREISGLNSKQLSTSMSTIRKMYRQIKNEDLL